MTNDEQFILFYGRMGGGKTLVAVKYIKDLLEKDSNAKVVSNIKLIDLPYEPYERAMFLLYRNRVVFLDMIDFMPELIKTRTAKSDYEKNQEVKKELETFFGNSNRLVATMQSPRFLYPSAARMVILALDCSMNKTGWINIADFARNRRYIIQDKENYYRFYDTMQISNWSKK